MAAAVTFSSSLCASGVVPRAIHAGVNSIYAYWSLTASLSLNDVICMARVPDGARIIDIKTGISMLHEGGPTRLNIGTVANPDLFVASTTCSTARVFGLDQYGGLGKVLTVSDSATTRYTEIRVKITDVATSLTATNAGSIRMLITYFMDTEASA
jgi:hypothetical protein